MSGLEAFLAGVKRDFFDDACLARYRGMSWAQFYSKTAKDRRKSRRKRTFTGSSKCDPCDPYASSVSSDSSDSSHSSHSSHSTDSTDSSLRLDTDAIILLPEKESDRLDDLDDGCDVRDIALDDFHDHADENSDKFGESFS